MSNRYSVNESSLIKPSNIRRRGMTSLIGVFQARNKNKNRVVVNTQAALKPSEYRNGAQMFGPMVPKKTNTNDMNSINEARQRLRMLNNERFNLLRKKRTMVTNKRNAELALNKLKVNKNMFIKERNANTRKQANERFDKNINNVQKKVNVNNNMKSINNRLQAIETNNKRLSNKRKIKNFAMRQ